MIHLEPLALYIHWPFCLHKCPYCDFNSHVRDRIDHRRFGAALRRELAWEGRRLGKRPLTSIFFGGGTPSLMDPSLVADLIADARTMFDPTSDIEITLEANPTSVEAAKLSLLRQAGINRVSLGVQALNDVALRGLGRTHSVSEALAALELARGLFPRISFDLIYARPGQDLEDWRAELRSALSLAADHLSLYQLTIEPGTQFASLHRQGRLILPDDDAQAAFYDATAVEAANFGMAAYEISNYARPNGASRHNLAYWRYGDYAGVGPGAHGRLSVAESLIATRRHRAPEPWACRVERDGHGSAAEETLSSSDRAREMLLMNLRLSEGMDEDRFLQRTGMPVDDAVHPAALANAIARGQIERRDGRFTATASGRLVLDALLPDLLL